MQAAAETEGIERVIASKIWKGKTTQENATLILLNASDAVE